MTLTAHPRDENFRSLTTFYQERGLSNNPTGFMDALVGWIESGKIPATCKQDCVLAKGQEFCPHSQPSILNKINASVVRDACLIVNLKRLGITGDLQYIRDKHGASLEEVIG